MPPPSRYKASHLFRLPQLGIHTSRHILNDPTVVHDHDFFEVAFVTGGAGVHVSASGEQQAQCGHGWILAPGAWHAYRNCQNLEICNCCFAASLLERDLAALRHDAGANHIFFQGPLALERRGIIAFNSPTNSIFQSWAALHGSSNSLICIARLLLFLGELATSLPVPHRAPLEKKRHPAVAEAVELLESAMQEEWTLKSLAGKLHLAPGYLARVFKEATGLAPIAWLHRLRCERAAQLLLQTDLPVAAVGVRVGWSDPNLFARRFRASYGISASQYRSRFRAGEN
ncbi:RCS-specific HTH-type transcriptional activator RclR [Abditibacteriota bacterium]|nr:RCS-specific HTH-type transcriptional activator RclR [Abditibacteriota bacterium]